MTTEPVATVSGQALVDQLVGILDLERIEEDIFRGRSPQVSMQRVFGGQVAGQALVAAGRTVDPEYAVHSLHAYFIRPGDPTVPIVYTVDRVRDGNSFWVRRVTAVQHGKPIFTLSASFQREQPGREHARAMPSGVPAPETLRPLAEWYTDYPQMASFARLPRPFDMRYVDPPPWARRAAAGQRDHGPSDAVSRVWMRADGRLPDDPLVHVCALTFASDLTLLDSVVVRHGVAMGMDKMVIASLDHAMWFHRPFRADEWFLYESTSPSASNSRGLASGSIFAADGRHLVTVMQEGLVRV